MKIAIYGYGNLGRGVETASKYHKDIEIIGVFFSFQDGRA